MACRAENQGLKELNEILSNINPDLSVDTWVFGTFPLHDIAQLPEKMSVVHSRGVCPISTFFEKGKGISLIVKLSDAHRLSDIEGFEYSETVFSQITLQIHSSLDAGVTAVISSHLAENDISANIVAGYYHDHIFVQASKAAATMKILHSISEEAKKSFITYM